jgi:CPA2 family monovalent cation:H+ antiporter-2
VLLVPRRRHTATTKPFRHVAVAVDFSAASDHAIEQALTLASDAADRITLVHVVPGFSAGVPPHLYRYGMVEYQEQLIEDARRRLQRVVPVKRHSAAAIHTRVLVGDTTTEISGVVDSIGADLLVVGVPKRGVVSRALFGTTAARLLRASSGPMLAVPEVAAATAHEESTHVPLAA